MLGNAGIVLATEVGQMRADDVLTAPNPGISAVNAGQKAPAACERRTLARTRPNMRTSERQLIDRRPKCGLGHADYPR